MNTLPHKQKSNAAFSFISHAYNIPSEQSLFIGHIVKSDVLKDLKVLDKRLKHHELTYKKNKKKLLKHFNDREKVLREKRSEIFFKALEKEIKTLNAEAYHYFESVQEQCFKICVAVMKRLHLDISSDEKVRAIIKEITQTHHSEDSLELYIPENCDAGLQSLSIPDNWEVITDKHLSEGICRLKMDFGEVVGDFDKSFAMILSSLKNMD